MLTTNPAYLASEVADEPYRLALPKEKDPNEKINIWSIVKDSIGKDLSKFAVPGEKIIHYFRNIFFLGYCYSSLVY